ncbi:MAG: dihydrofolate reductase family protein, partial [Actinomycetota bacterium]|nr:dihydrofolate reductase family protein [Actinomycetota bacterium]
EVFRALRALADGILVGAGTVRVEGYGPHRLGEPLAARRRADGRDAPAPIVVVSRSLALDATSPLFTDAVTPTVVLTCAAASPGRRRALQRVARLLVAGDEAVDLVVGVGLLRSQLGLARLLCEGGPTLTTGLLRAGLVDELCLTVAPELLGAGGPQIVRELDRRVGLGLAAAFAQDDELYLRYRVGGAERPTRTG